VITRKKMEQEDDIIEILEMETVKSLQLLCLMLIEIFKAIT